MVSAINASDPSPPLLSFQRANELCDEVERQSLVVGDNWCLITHSWWMSFMEAKDNPGANGLIYLPPINNELLTIKKNGVYELKSQLVDNLDFILIPEHVFIALKSAFGIVLEERDYIKRKVIENAMFDQSLAVEIYPIVLKIANVNVPENIFELKVSKSDSIENICAKAMDMLNIPDADKDNVRFLAEEDGKLAELVPAKMNAAAISSLLLSDVVIYLDAGVQTSYSSAPAVTRRSTTNNESSTYRPPGLCGLQNMGNTCFMNSALQCLSNVPELTAYFLTDSYLKEINERNVLGSQGRLARAYGYLIKEMWAGNVFSVKPSKLKAVIGEVAPRFNGYNQQDSQELTSFLLDGLHEDLNRIREKPYIEEKEDDSVPHEQRAEQAWSDYKKRNDSIIVDLLHGQLKSTVVCPVCEKVSVKFDPFCFLSVPVPAKERQTISVITLVRNEKWAKFAITHSSKATAAQAIAEIRSHLKLPDVTRIVLMTSYAAEVLTPDAILTSPYATMSTSRSFYAFIVEEGPLLVVENKASVQDRILGVPLVVNMPGDGKTLSRRMVYDIVVPIVQERLWKKTTNKTLDIDMDEDEDEENIIPEKTAENPLPSDIIFYCDRKYICLPHDNIDECATIPEDNAGDFKICLRWKTNDMFQSVDINRLVEREINMTTVMKKCYSLDECLDMFTSEEQLDQNDSWYCPRCKTHQQAYKKLDLWKLPKILIVHLKRFQYSRYNRDKIETDIAIPTKNFDLSKKLLKPSDEPTKYDLIAISNHVGGLGSGHYTALALNGDTWVDFNDSLSTPTRNTKSSMPDSLLSREAYILYYRRQDNLKSVAVDAKKVETAIKPTTSASKSSASKKVMNGSFGSPTTRSAARNLNHTLNGNNENIPHPANDTGDDVKNGNRDTSAKRRSSESMKMEIDD